VFISFIYLDRLLISCNKKFSVCSIF